MIDHYLGQIYLEDKQSFEEKLLKKEQMIEELQSKYNKLIKISNPPPQEELMIIQRELEILRDSKLNLIKDLKKLIKEKLKSTESLILEYTNEIALLKNKLKYLGEREKKAEEECQLSELEKRRSELLNSKQKFFQELVLLIKNEVPKTDFDESTQEIEGLLKFEITKTQDSDYRNNLLNELKSFFRTLLNTAKNKKYADRLREEVKNLLYFQLDFAIDDVYRKKMKIELEELLRQQIDATPDALHKARLINELKDLVSDSIKRSVISDSVF